MKPALARHAARCGVIVAAAFLLLCVLAMQARATEPASSGPAIEPASAGGAIEPASAGGALRIAVYDLQPYGHIDAKGLFSGASVDLWRRVAEDMQVTYRFIAVPRMDDILAGLEHGAFDVAVGAITITPERLARVDFSYPAHGSGVAVALPKRNGPLAAILSWNDAVQSHASLIEVTLALLVFAGALLWAFERRRRIAAAEGDSAVASLFDGIYWAVVTMTTVGYGDKTPKTGPGRFVAVVWMLASLALVSLVSSTLVSSMTADRLEAGPAAHDSDLAGKRLAAVESSSGAEYLESEHLAYTKYLTLDDALASLADGRSDAVVNSVGALRYLIATRYSGVVPVPSGLLAPAYMAFALPRGSLLRGRLDRSLVRVTASPGWRAQEDSYFEH